MRFIHSSDLHLGKPFGRLPEEIRHRLREARHGAILRLAALARAEGAPLILLAGDTFDAETPSPATWRQALSAMAADPAITWVLLPGNHDSLAASELWRRLAANLPGNLRLALEPAPLALPEATLLPAPCTARRPGRDLTAWFDSAPSEAGLRLGLAHGGVTDFTSGEGVGAAGIIAPDRARRAGLDWLALGDWHGERRIDPRSAYSGTPERDSFRHGAESPRGSALSVHLSGPGALPEVQSHPTGAFDWLDLSLEALAGLEPLALLEALLPPPAQRRDSLLRLTLTGRTAPDTRAALLRRLGDLAPEFGHLAPEASGLRSLVASTDLDRIDHGGALRAAAEALHLEAGNADLGAEARQIASAALERLFELAAEDEAEPGA